MKIIMAFAVLTSGSAICNLSSLLIDVLKVAK